MEIVLQDPGVDAVLVILTPQAMTDPTGTAQAVAEVARRVRKPILAAWMGGASVQEGIRILNQAGIPTYLTPDQAVQAFMHLVDYGRNLDLLYQTPREIPVEFALDRKQIRETFLPRFAKTKALGEREAKELLAAYGIPVTMPELARTEEEAVAVAQKLGFPVVLKIQSPDILHKTDVGGVLLGIRTAEGCVRAFARSWRTCGPGGRRPASRGSRCSAWPRFRRG